MPQCLTCHQMFQAYDAIRPLPGAGGFQMRWDYCRDCLINAQLRPPDDEILPGDPRRPIDTGTGGRRIADIPAAHPALAGGGIAGALFPAAHLPFAGGGAGAGAGAGIPPLPPGPILPPGAPVTFQPPKCLSGMECTICMAPMDNIDTLTVLNCGDIFHTVCISGHISSDYGGSVKDCPLCREHISAALPISLAYPISEDTHSPRSLESARHVAKIQTAIDKIPADTAASDEAGARARAAALKMGGTIAWPIIEPGDRRWHRDTPACERCARHFSLIVRRHHCRRCGYCICDRCSVEMQHSGGRRVRVCTSAMCAPAV